MFRHHHRRGKHIQKVNCLGGGGDSTVCGKRAIRSKVPEELIADLFRGVVREVLADEKKYIWTEDSEVSRQC